MRFKNITLIALFSFLFAVGMSAQTFFSEDFGSGIPDTWENIEVEGNGMPSSVWLYTTEGPTGPTPYDALMSTTAGNGFVIFDSDLNNNLGSAQNAWLISPEIDATAEDVVWLVFETYYRSFDDRPQLRVGTDLNDLDSWATIEVFPGIGATDFNASNPETMTFDLSEFAANSTFRFAFQYLSDDTTNNGGGTQGWGYAWQVDDVSLTNVSPLPPVDMALANDFYGIAPNAVTPASQVAPFGFIVDVENVGSGTIASSTVDVSIANSSAVVFTDSNDFGSLEPGEQFIDYIFENQFTPDAVADDFQLTYTITPGEGNDPNPLNNSSTFNFSVSDSLFSKDLGATRSVAPVADNNYSYSCVYYVPDGEGMYARYVSFGVVDPDGELAGNSCNIFLYEWEGDTNNDGTVNTAEMTAGQAIAFNSYQFQGDENQVILTLPIDLDAEAIPLQSGKYYVIAIQYVATADENMFLLASEEFNYFGMNYLSDSLNTNDNTVPIQYASALDVGNSGEYGILGFGFDIVPLIRMSIGNNDDLSGDAIVAAREVILADGSVGVFPNPVDQVANVEFKLSEVSENVTLEIFDLKGRMVSRTKYEQVQEQTVNVDVSYLPAGNYKMRARTDNGIKTVNLAIQR
jgi:hypothetical protein